MPRASNVAFGNVEKYKINIRGITIENCLKMNNAVFTFDWTCQKLHFRITTDITSPTISLN